MRCASAAARKISLRSERKLLQPGRDVGGVVGKIAVGDRDPEFAADHHLADFGALSIREACLTQAEVEVRR